MKFDLPPVLLTSSVIAMDRSVALKDPGQRIGYTLESIAKWLAMHADMRLVICDGSGYDFSETVKNTFPGHSIECLYFENDKQLVERHGKGYGEGEIIKHALLHSVFLRDAEWFAKCTAKLWVDNFDDCLQEWNGFLLLKAYFANVFSLKKTIFEYIDTRFYLATKDAYLKFFSEAHLKVGAQFEVSIEDNFKEIVLRNDLKHVFFSVHPVICGVGGGSGTYYRTNLKRRIKDAIRSKLVQMDSSFSDMFNRNKES